MRASGPICFLFPIRVGSYASQQHTLPWKVALDLVRSGMFQAGSLQVPKRTKSRYSLAKLLSRTGLAHHQPSSRRRNSPSELRDWPFDQEKDHNSVFTRLTLLDPSIHYRRSSHAHCFCDGGLTYHLQRRLFPPLNERDPVLAPGTGSVQMPDRRLLSRCATMYRNCKYICKRKSRHSMGWAFFGCLLALSSACSGSTSQWSPQMPDGLYRLEYLTAHVLHFSMFVRFCASLSLFDA